MLNRSFLAVGLAAAAFANHVPLHTEAQQSTTSLPLDDGGIFGLGKPFDDGKPSDERIAIRSPPEAVKWTCVDQATPTRLSSSTRPGPGDDSDERSDADEAGVAWAWCCHAVGNAFGCFYDYTLDPTFIESKDNAPQLEEQRTKFWSLEGLYGQCGYNAQFEQAYLQESFDDDEDIAIGTCCVDPDKRIWCDHQRPVHQSYGKQSNASSMLSPSRFLGVLLACLAIFASTGLAMEATVPVVALVGSASATATQLAFSTAESGNHCIQNKSGQMICGSAANAEAKRALSAGEETPAAKTLEFTLHSRAPAAKTLAPVKPLSTLYPSSELKEYTTLTVVNSPGSMNQANGIFKAVLSVAAFLGFLW